jgi:4-alpha-glucanotransferase
MADVPDALRQHHAARWTRLVEPVVLAWDGRLDDPPLRIPAAWSDDPIACRLELEDGEVDEWEQRRRGPLPVSDTAEVDGVRYVETVVRLRRDVPGGYHRLRLSVHGLEAETVLIAAPARAPGLTGRGWGVFLPLYALRSERSWGLGDLGDLGNLVEWTGRQGGTVVATLPLFAAFLDVPFEPSPYAPASRLFWNEVYAELDPTAPGIPKALREEVRRLNRAPRAPYREAMAAKRRVLEALAEERLARPGPLREGFRRFAADPRVRDYAAFRANTERHGSPWPSWPGAERDGRLPKHGGDERSFRTHVFAQWLMARQMGEVANRAAAAGTRVYVDLPLGVHPHGYDVWRDRGSFLAGASTGAPPDTFFLGGQDWGFPPPHPEGLRETGYAYPAAVYRHVMRHAGMVRLDHVMSLHRLYVIPPGSDADNGVYLRYPAEELYAVLTLEAARAGCVVVGEDLGTVPGEVRTAMRRHGILRTHVAELEATPDHPLPPVPFDALASLNTHDLPTFAAYWRGEDVDLRRRLGLIDTAQARRETAERRRTTRGWARGLRAEGLLEAGAGAAKPPVRTALEHLAESPAAMVVANLEDLWGERKPQNVPGTTLEYPNWSRPARLSLVRLASDRRVLGTLKVMDRLRGEGSTA